MIVITVLGWISVVILFWLACCLVVYAVDRIVFGCARDFDFSSPIHVVFAPLFGVIAVICLLGGIVSTLYNKAVENWKQG